MKTSYADRRARRELFQAGRRIVYRKETPMSNLFLTMRIAWKFTRSISRLDRTGQGLDLS